MSYYLKLLPLRGPEALDDSGGTYPYSILEVQQDYGIIGQILNLSSYRSADRQDIPEVPHIKTRPIPERFWLYWGYEDGEEKVRDDPYGEELTWAYAGEFKKLVLPEDAHPFHKALKAYIDQLPNDIPIIVWPH